MFQLISLTSQYPRNQLTDHYH